MRTASASETEAVAAGLASRLVAGDVVLLHGEVGAGKTTFVRGAARALGVQGPITSPTYSIGHRYTAADVTVSHVDLYRVAALVAEEPELLGDYLGAGRIAFVEWPQVGAAELLHARVTVTMTHAGGDRRSIALSERPAGEPHLGQRRPGGPA